MVVDISIAQADIHQMIMRYICAYFNQVAIDPKIGLLKYEQLILLLKNKYINVPNEDIVLNAVDNWVLMNSSF